MVFFGLPQIEATIKMLHTPSNTVVEAQPRPPTPTIPLSSPPPDQQSFGERTYFLDSNKSDTISSNQQDDSKLSLQTQEDLAKLSNSKYSQQRLETVEQPTTPPLTHEPFTPTTSPETPITPRYKQDVHYARHLPMSPLLELSKDPLFIPSPSKDRSSSFQRSSPIKQFEDKTSHPVPVSLFRILNEKQHTIRPNYSSIQEPLQLTKSTPTTSCLLRSSNTFEARDFRAITVLNPVGRPAWWCRFDNLVVFDGMSVDSATNSLKPMTRTSKGLAFANRMGEQVIVILDLECGHCREVLGLNLWKYEAKVCKRSVCAACKAMCRQEWAKDVNSTTLQDGPRYIEVGSDYVITL